MALKYVYEVDITNSSSVATGTSFQQMITVDWSKIAGVDNGIGNVRFMNDTAGTSLLYAWLESGTSNTASGTVWVNLPNGVPANGTAVIYLGVYDSGTNFDGVYWGEAPQLSATYAEYDNGTSVFAWYQAWGGLSALPPNWNNDGTVLTYYDKYIEIAPNSSTGGWYGIYISNDYIGDRGVVEFYGNDYQSTTYSSYAPGSLFGWQSSTSLAQTKIQYSFGNGKTGSQNEIYLGNDATQYDIDTGISDFNENKIYSLYYNGTFMKFEINYNQSFSSNSLVSQSTAYFAIMPSNNGGSHPADPFHVYYTRDRTFPPDGVMPSASIGKVLLSLSDNISSGEERNIYIAKEGKLESGNMSEEKVLSLGKGIGDDIKSGEVYIFNTAKGLEEKETSVESRNFIFNTAKTDSMSEGESLVKGISAVKDDDGKISDGGYSSSIGKGISETIDSAEAYTFYIGNNLDDKMNFAEYLAKLYSTIKEDSIGESEERNILFGKSKLETVNINEFLFNWNFSMSMEDGIGNNDINIGKIVDTVKLDKINSTESLVRYISAILSGSINSSDVIGVYRLYYLSLSDKGEGIDGGIGFNIGKGIKDNFLKNEDISKFVDKGIGDISKVKDFLVRQSGIGMGDSIGIVDSGIKYYIGKVLRENVVLKLAYILGIDRNFADKLDSLESINFVLNKIIEDDIKHTDMEIKNLIEKGIVDIENFGEYLGIVAELIKRENVVLADTLFKERISSIFSTISHYLSDNGIENIFNTADIKTIDYARQTGIYFSASIGDVDMYMNGGVIMKYQVEFTIADRDMNTAKSEAEKIKSLLAGYDNIIGGVGTVFLMKLKSEYLDTNVRGIWRYVLRYEMDIYA